MRPQPKAPNYGIRYEWGGDPLAYVPEYERQLYRRSRRRLKQGGWVQLVVFIIATILSIALAPKPPRPRAATLEDFEVPTADEERTLPVVFGRVLVTGPNVLWYGHLDRKALKKSSLFGSTTIGYKYYISMFVSISHGPVDEISGIQVDEKDVGFAGHLPLTDNGFVNASSKDLFGGKKGEGGVIGGWNFYFGAGDQGPLTQLEDAAEIGKPQPGYRGALTAFWQNSNVNPDTGYIGNSRYLKVWAFEVMRRSAGWDGDAPWYPEKIAIGDHAMNPAHILYQTLTDSEWGMNRGTGSLPDALWRAAADTLHDEGLGLRLIWNHASTIEDFVSTILEHCDGTLAIDPVTGGVFLKLIRGDYDIEDLPVFDESNIDRMDSFQRQVWGETINELTVVYTDPVTLKKSPVTVHDLANIQAQGLVHETVNLPGLYDAELATRAAMRELQVRSTPLAKMRFTTNRQAWNKVQGDVIVVRWPDEDFDSVVRVLKATKGNVRDGVIVIEGVEDIFALGVPTYTTVPDNEAPADTPGLPDDVDTTGPSVVAADMTAPPVSPVDGASYFVPTGATGDWAGHAGEVATWDEDDAAWIFETIPPGGTTVTETSSGETVVLNPDGTSTGAPYTPSIPPLTLDAAPVLTNLHLVAYDHVNEEYIKVDADDVGGSDIAVLDDIPDVNVPAPLEGDYLRRNAANEWIGVGGISTDADQTGDPFWEYVVALLKFDGADASTTMTDSTGKRLWTARGNAQLDTAEFKFGTASLLLDGTGDWIDTPSTPDFQLTNQSFTYEAWIRLSTTGKTHTIFNKRDASSAEEHSFQITSANVLILQLFSGGSSVGTATGATVLTTGVWYHVAWVRNGTNLLIFLDGALEASTGSISGSASTNTEVMKIGRDGFDTARDFQGWIDSVRITRGIARYTSAFTAPTAEWPTTSRTTIIDDEIVVDSPMAYWKCDEPSGTILDYSASGSYPLTVTGAVNYQRAAIVPSSAKSYLRVPASAGTIYARRAGTLGFSQPISGTWTVEAVVRLEELQGTENHRVLVIGASGELSTQNFQIYVGVDETTGGMFTFWESGAGTDFTYSSSKMAIPRGRPVHLVWTKNPTGRVLQYYVDGALADQATWTSGDDVTGGSLCSTAIGDEFGAGNSGFTVAHLAVYNTVLSEARIRAHAIAGGFREK